MAARGRRPKSATTVPAFPRGLKRGRRPDSSIKPREGQKYWHKAAEGESQPMLMIFVSEQSGDTEPDTFLPRFMETNLKVVAADCTNFKSTKGRTSANQRHRGHSRHLRGQVEEGAAGRSPV